MFLILTAPAVFGDSTIIRVNQAAAQIGRFFTAGDLHSKDSIYAVYRELNARGFHLFCKSHGMREGIAEYGRNGRINLHMMIHF